METKVEVEIEGKGPMEQQVRGWLQVWTWVFSRFAVNAPPQPLAAHPTGKRLTTICASLRSFKMCSLVQLVFAATPEGEPGLCTNVLFLIFF